MNFVTAATLFRLNFEGSYRAILTRATDYLHSMATILRRDILVRGASRRVAIGGGSIIQRRTFSLQELDEKKGSMGVPEPTIIQIQSNWDRVSWLTVYRPGACCNTWLRMGWVWDCPTTRPEALPTPHHHPKNILRLHSAARFYHGRNAGIPTGDGTFAFPSWHRSYSCLGRAD